MKLSEVTRLLAAARECNTLESYIGEYGIPRRTMQNWLTETNNHSNPPQYLMRLILADLI